MKFGNIVYSRTGRITIGDDMQLLAIENLYKQMGIDYSEVVRVEFRELHEYDGEKIILPISFPFYGLHDGMKFSDFSKKIIPVFLGLSILAPIISQEDVDYLKKFEPIGCRDKYTTDILRKYDINAFLFGCITQTYPKMRINNDKEYNKIFCVDIDDVLKKEIPKELRPLCEYTTHIRYRENTSPASEEIARAVYSDYINNAKLVITSRLHAALPCMAAGIPVIWAKDKYSFRFVGNDLHLKIYTEREYSIIDWNALPIDYEEQKLKMITYAKNRILSEFAKFNDVLEFLGNEELVSEKKYFVEFIDNTIEYIDNKWKKDDRIDYVVWGATQTAKTIIHYLGKNYPNSNLKGVIDKNTKIKFGKYQAYKKEWLTNKKDVFTFVCTGAAIKDSEEFFFRNNILQYYQCCLDGNKEQINV